ncbi:DNA-directed RNA polymerase V subunit 7 [Citrus sinensis]|nr:DNA-directed RNA polymerase V subunit 7 [Citrus sinensis]
MFVKVKLPWNVVDPAENLVTIVICLLDDFAGRKSTKDLGCYLAVTTLESTGEGKVRENAGEMLFPVVFIGKIFQGIVHKMLKHGVLFNCVSIDMSYLHENAYLPKMLWVEVEREFHALVSLKGDFLREAAVH